MMPNSWNMFTVRHAIHKRRKHNKMGPETVMSMANFNSVQSVHDFHKYAIHHNGMATVLHFHLAASINPETGKYTTMSLP